MVMARDTITPSKKNYGVELQGAKNVYLCNKEAVELKAGKKFFITYTVSELESDLSTQSGVVITRDATLDYPYEQGTMQYLQSSVLLSEGTTYFYRFEMTNTGYTCTAGWAKGDESDYIGMPLVEGKIQEGCQYFGIWFGGSVDTNMVGRLTRVRCYDENGKDLGIQISGFGAEATAYDPEEREALQPNDTIKNRYSITLDENSNIQISNRKQTKSDVVYMEYTVKSVSKDTLWQSGMIHNYSPTTEYPSGFWRQEVHDTENYSGCRLLKSGVSYIIRYTLTDDGMEVLLKYKENGKYVYYEYPRFWGKSNKEYGFFSLWFGEGTDSKVSAELINFKCYDKDGNNLGVQINQGVQAVHQGGLEDYSGCLAAYYNEELEQFIWLDKDNQVSVVTGERTEAGTYVIDGTTLRVTIGEVTQEYKYLYRYIEDDEQRKYIRMKDYMVRFVSGVVSGDELLEMKATSETGYRIGKPDDPIMEGNRFLSWCCADGTEFDFDKVVTESLTLYAKWQDGDGHVFIVASTEAGKMDMAWFVVGGVCLLMVTCTTIGFVFLVKKKKCSGGKDDE